MAQPRPTIEVEISLAAEEPQPSASPQPEWPFHILILGDFSGRANRGLNNSRHTPLDFQPTLVDRDNLDQVMGQFKVELHLPIFGETGSHLSMKFCGLEDFHPDRIVERLDFFQAYMELRQRLSDLTTFPEAAAELRGWNKTKSQATLPTSPTEPSPPTSKKPESLSTKSLLDQLLEDSPDPNQKQPEMQDREGWREFIEAIVAPYAIPSPDPQQTQLLAQVEMAMGEQLRNILHDSDYQTVEAGWRGLSFLTQRLETGTQLKLYVIDVSKTELIADLNESEDLRSSKLYSLLVDQAARIPGAQPWTVVAGNYTFDSSLEDIELLNRLAKIAQQAGAPFLAQASTRVVGGQSVAETPDVNDWQHPLNSESWETLRQLPEASYIGLTLPRVLLRLPYGPESDPIETVKFEEMPALPNHEDYLWGNPIFACLYLLGRGFSQDGWTFRPDVFLEVDNLPVHVYKENGESRIKPCAEALLSERTAEIILETGLMPFFSVKNQDTIRLARFQSIAKPLKPLSGRWI